MASSHVSVPLRPENETQLKNHCWNAAQDTSKRGRRPRLELTRAGSHPPSQAATQHDVKDQGRNVVKNQMTFMREIPTASLVSNTDPRHYRSVRLKITRGADTGRWKHLMAVSPCVATPGGTTGHRQGIKSQHDLHENWQRFPEVFPGIAIPLADGLR